MTNPITRRTFLHRASIAAATTVACPAVLRSASPNRKLNLAGIGVGGKGYSDITAAVGKEHNCVAICDVDLGSSGKAGISKAAKKFPDAKVYQDFRKLLERKDLDGVTISTPDHMHAPIALAAMARGLHVTTQKPLTTTIADARRMKATAEKHKRITQMGNQHHNGIPYRMLVQLIQDGAIGKIKEVHTWSNRPIWPQGIDRPAGSDPVPKDLDWDVWLGVAPKRPFVDGVYHPFAWRGWFDFGAGALGDMGCHIMDPVVWRLGLTEALSVTADAPKPTAETYPKKSTVRYVFRGTKHTAGETLPMTWYDGGRQPDRKLAPMPEQFKLSKSGGLYIGEKGVIYCPHGGGPQLLPKEDFTGYDRPNLDRIDHYGQWTDAIRGEGKTTSHFGYAANLTEVVLLGTIAQRFPGQKLLWDAKAMTFRGFPKANALVDREHRKSFTL